MIPPDFSREIYQGKRAEIQFLVDGGYPYRALTIDGYAQAIIGAFAAQVMESKVKRIGASQQLIRPIAIETRYFFNESLRSSYALVPGLLVIILLMNPAVLTALAIAREKEFGTIYNIYSTPVRKWEFLVGKIMPYLSISAINLFVIVVTIRYLFQIPMKGHFLSLLPGALLYVLINVSFGLLVSSVTKTMVSAQVVTVIITVIPAFLYSGLLIPVANLEGVARFMAHLYPSMHFMKIVHGVYLKDLELGSLLPQMIVLALYFIVLFSAAIFVFRKRER